LVVSCAVLEEVEHLDRGFAAMDGLLRPGGRMVHAIDLSDYGIFTRQGLHPLTHLTVPDPVYRLVRTPRMPNRRHLDWYRAKMAELGYRADLLATKLVGERNLETPKSELAPGVDYDEGVLALVEEIRPRLRPRYRRASVEQLLVASAVLI